MQETEDTPESRKAEPHGLGMMRTMIAGAAAAPSMSTTMNFLLEEVGEGKAVFAGTPTEDHYNPAGAIHGGWAATILDSALGCAVQTTLDNSEAYTTVEFKVNLVRPMTHKIGRLTCTGTVLSRGRRIATSEARLVDENGRLIAFGTETCIIMSA